MSDLRTAAIRLAYARPELRLALLPLVSDRVAKPESAPAKKPPPKPAKAEKAKTAPKPVSLEEIEEEELAKAEKEIEARSQARAKAKRSRKIQELELQIAQRRNEGGPDMDRVLDEEQSELDDLKQEEADDEARDAARERAKKRFEAKAKAESEAKAKADSEAKAKAESEAKAKADSEAKAKAEKDKAQEQVQRAKDKDERRVKRFEKLESKGKNLTKAEREELAALKPKVQKYKREQRKLEKKRPKDNEGAGYRDPAKTTDEGSESAKDKAKEQAKDQFDEYKKEHPSTKKTVKDFFNKMMGKLFGKKSNDLRAATIRLAYRNPELRPALLPLLREAAAGISAQARSILLSIEDWETGKANRPPALFSSRAISVAAKLERDGYYESRADGPHLTAKGKAALAEAAAAPTVWKRTIRDLGDDVKRGWITPAEKDALVKQLASAPNQWEADAVRNEYLKRKGY